MIIRMDGTKLAGKFPRYVQGDVYPVNYPGFSCEAVYDERDLFGEDTLGFDLPATHLLSAWHERICGYCQQPLDDSAEMDHIVPYSKGGAHLAREFSSVDNESLACAPCNRKKGEKLGWSTFDGRTGFYWDGSPGGTTQPPPMPARARKRR